MNIGCETAKYLPNRRKLLELPVPTARCINKAKLTQGLGTVVPPSVASVALETACIAGSLATVQPEFVAICLATFGIMQTSLIGKVTSFLGRKQYVINDAYQFECTPRDIDDPWCHPELGYFEDEYKPAVERACLRAVRVPLPPGANLRTTVAAACTGPNQFYVCFGICYSNNPTVRLPPPGFNGGVCYSR